MGCVWIVFAKESIDNLRDRRSLFMALIYPFVGALLLGLLLSFVGGMFKRQAEVPGEVATSTLVLPVKGAEQAPELVAWLQQNGVEVVAAPDDPRDAVQQGRSDIVLVLADNYAQRFRAQEPAGLRVVINATRLSTVLTVSRIVQKLRSYADHVSRERLRGYGVPELAAQPLEIQNDNVGRSRSLAGFFLNMLPPFIIFTIFVGGVYLAIDTTSGERERGSLEPLLANPVPRWQLMLGKALATFAFTVTAVLFQLAAFKVMFEIVTRADFGIVVNPGIGAFLLAFLIALPLIALAVALQIIVATVSRSYKETQTYLGLLPLIPSLPGMILVFIPLKAQIWMMAVPTFSQVLLIGKLMREERVYLTEALIAGASTAAVALALFVLAGKLYERDKLLFGG
jgi:sodium transport system permease protein